MEFILSKRRPTKYKRGQTIKVNNIMEEDYSYILEESPGKNMREDFTPNVSPKEMLRLGIFEGKYMNDQILEFTRDWYMKGDKLIGNLSPSAPDIEKNYYKIKSRQPLQVWKSNGWIPVTKTRIGKAHMKRF